MKQLSYSLHSGIEVIRYSFVGGPLAQPIISSAFPLFFLSAMLLAGPCAATPGKWEYTGSLKIARFHHTATLLADGRVLVAGGAAGVGGDRPLKSAELYDPATGAWSD